MKRFWLLAVFLLVGATATGLRLSRLSLRPMHPDEAVHACKFGALLEEGFYNYDPHEYHGPVLNYLSLIPAWFCGVTSYSQTTESMLRIVPALASILMVLLFFAVADGLGRAVAALSAALMAVSPVFVFYGRYYIQETLLVFFTANFIFAAYLYCRNKKWWWAIFAGFSLGLMHATKETFIINVAAMVAAAAITCYRHKRLLPNQTFKDHAIPKGVLIALLTAAFTSSLFYSSFFTNLHGIIDSLAALGNYIHFTQERQIHFHPWYYYFRLLIYSKSTEGPVWSEIFIVLFTLAGFMFALRKHDFHPLLRFIAIYTLVMIMIYSSIPYKTPWCMSGFVWGLIIIAAVGIVHLYRRGRQPLFRILMTLVVIAGMGHLAWQAYMQDCRYYADSGNPYVYSHTTDDISKIIRDIEHAAASADAENTRINVISNENYWPLPWYLRKFKHVGWFSEVNEAYFPATITIASPSLEDEVIDALYRIQPIGARQLYAPLFQECLQIRPGVELRGYITHQLWERMKMPIDKDMWSRSSSPNHQPLAVSAGDRIGSSEVFSHEAMATSFEISLVHPDKAYAEQAAIAAFNLLDQIEADLSKYIPNSDISRLNVASQGDVIRLNPLTYKCLEQSLALAEKTFGAFDVNVGKRMEHENDNSEKTIEHPPGRYLPLAQTIKLGNDFTALILSDDVAIDLGGIGKGFAIDQMVAILQRWGIEYGFIHSGTSTARALQSPAPPLGWSVSITNPFQPEEIIHTVRLDNNAIGCSGTIHRQHIIDPRTSLAVTRAKMVWVTCQTALEADALSTALVVLNSRELERFFNFNKNCGAIIAMEANDGSFQINRWGSLK